MTGKKTGETFVLKHRLTGAAILIAFAVIVLPMLLGGPEPAGEQGDGPPSGAADKQVFQSNIKPIGGEIPENRADPAAGEEERPEAPPAGGDDAQQPVVAAIDEPEQAPDDGSGAAGTDAGGEEAASDAIERGWIVQVGVFKNPDNVQKLVTDLENGGFGASTGEVDTSEGRATRVWVGPFETRVEAARTKTRVKQRTGTEGLIVAYP